MQFEVLSVDESTSTGLFQVSPEDGESLLPKGMLHHKLEVLEVDDKKGVDLDIAALKNQMNELKEQKHLRKYGKNSLLFLRSRYFIADVQLVNYLLTTHCLFTEPFW